MSRVDVSLVLTCVVAFSLPALAADERDALPQGNNGIASRYVGDMGIEKDPAVIYATGFENGITGGLKKLRSGVVILDERSMARTGGACAQITATRGKDSGGDLKYTWKEGVEQCFVRFYCRFHEDSVAPHHFVNLGGHMPTYKYRYQKGFDTSVEGMKVLKAYLGHATSEDGIRWTRDPDNPILGPGVGGSGSWEEDGACMPTAILDGDTLKIWYVGLGRQGSWYPDLARGFQYQIGCAEKAMENEG